MTKDLKLEKEADKRIEILSSKFNYFSRGWVMIESVVSISMVLLRS